MSFPAGLTLVLIHLKLTNHIDWPWWLVMCPFILNVILNIAEKPFK